MKKILNIYMITSLIVMLQSCGDFLEVEPIGQPYADKFYRDVNEVQLGLNAVFSVLAESDFQDNLALIGSGCSDNMTMVTNLRFTDIENLTRLDMDPTNPLIESFWSVLYKGIFRANQFIYNSREIGDVFVVDTVNNQSEERIIQRDRVGQGKFLRAFFYFNLVRTFGGVPIKPESPNISATTDNLIQPRSTVTEVYDYIERDLREAVIGLSRIGRNRPAEEKGKVEMGAALSLLAKVIAYRCEVGVGDPRWQEVKKYTSHIIGTDMQRFTVAELLDGQRLYVPYDLSVEQAQNDLLFETISMDDFLKQEVSLGANGYQLNPSYNSLWTLGSDFSEEMIFEVNHAITELNQNLGTSFYNYFGNSNVLQPIARFPKDFSGDARVLSSIGVQVEVVFGRVVGKPDGGGYGGLTEPEQTANNKWYVWNADRPVSANDNPQNLKLMRYAEVLLWHAEALNETGNPILATDFLNQLRSRARGIVGDHPSFNDPSFNLDYTAAGYIDTRARIWRDRRAELCFEFDRYYDLMRTGQATEAYANVEILDNAQFYSKNFVPGINEVLPIPASEVRLSNGVVSQNPGY
ncbi:MAG: hypothetical protein ACI9A7_000932 [Cyclobacteriaceae bacterium]|jgi:hypothetical protein